MMNPWIYLDNNATTPPTPAVVEAMSAALRAAYANPSSIHPFGQAVRHAVEQARARVAALIGAAPAEIVFTSGGTESINLAIRGALATNPARRHLVTTTIEHSAVLSVFAEIKAAGLRVDHVGVDRDGLLDEEHFKAVVTSDTALVSLIHANNETGVVWDIGRLAAIAADCGAAMHVDAVQSAGKLPIDVSRWGAALVSLSAHKFHGPTGAGALYVRRGTRLRAIITGGGQERGLRGGTENVAGIIGMGVAAEAAAGGMAGRAERVGRLRDRLEAGIIAAVPDARVVGTAGQRLYNTSNIVFPAVRAEVMLILLGEERICASSGAACSSGSLEPSHVLRAMGFSEEEALSAIRFSLSEFNAAAEIERVIEVAAKIVERVRGMKRV